MLSIYIISFYLFIISHMGSLSHIVVAALYLQQRDVPATYILKREKGDAFSRFRFVLEKLWRDPREMCNKDPCWQSIQAPANADPLGNWIDIIKTVVGWTIFFGISVRKTREMKEMGKRCSDNFLSMVNDAVHPTQHHSFDPPKKEKKKKAAA